LGYLESNKQEFPLEKEGGGNFVSETNPALCMSSCCQYVCPPTHLANRLAE